MKQIEPPPADVQFHIKLSVISKLLKDGRITFDDVERISALSYDDVLDIAFQYCSHMRVTSPWGDKIMIYPRPRTLQ